MATRTMLRAAGDSRRDIQAALLLTLFGVLVRVGHLTAPHVDSDQAVFGLQAMHVLRGEFPAFSWGYSYIGTLQTYLVALFFAVFGPSRALLNGVALLFYAGYGLSLYYLGAAFFCERRWRVLVAALGALAPGYFVLHGVWARHGYPETFFFGTLLLALICNHLEREERPRFYALLFFVAGLAWWSNFLVVSYFPPLALYFAWQLAAGSSARSRARVVLASALGFVAGSAPFWLHNLRRGFPSLSIFRQSPAPGGASDEVAGTIWSTFTVLVGAREQGAGITVPYLGPILAVLCAAALLFFVGHRAARLARIPARRRLAPGDVLLVFLLSLVVVFAAKRQSPAEIRYFIPFYSLYPVCLAYALARLARLRGGKHLSLALALFILAMNAASALAWNPLLNRTVREKYRAEMATEQRLFDALEQAGRRRILTYNYWNAYRLTFDAKERFVIDDVDSRHPEYLFDTFSGSDLSYLFGRRTRTFEEGLRLLGFTWRQLPAGGFTLYTDFARDPAPERSAIPAARYRLAAVDTGQPADALSDRFLGTRHPLVSGGATEASLDAVFEEPVALAGLALFLADRRHAPRGIRITDLDTGRVLAESAAALFGYSAGGLPYLPSSPPFLEVAFPPVSTRGARVSLLGATREPGFSAAELLLFAARPAPAGSDDELFARIAREPRWSGVFCGMAAVRPLERALGRRVDYRRERPVRLDGRNLFVFEREYLPHNLEVLDALGVGREFAVGGRFAAVFTRGGGSARACWIEKALFRDGGAGAGHSPRGCYTAALR